VCRAIPAQTLAAPGDSSPHLFVPAVGVFVPRRRLAIGHLESPGLKFHLKKIDSLTHRFIDSLVFSF